MLGYFHASLGLILKDFFSCYTTSRRKFSSASFAGVSLQFIFHILHVQTSVNVYLIGLASYLVWHRRHRY